MPYRDYYNVLGVPRNASPDEIKKAYRVLARRWHPDRNPDDDEVVQRFKDITAAYKTLSDPDERARYDRLGPLYTPDGRPPRPEEVNDAVGTMFGNLFRRRRGNQRGDDLRYTLAVTLEDVAAGAEREVSVPRRVRCGDCAGSGAAGSGRSECPVCGGSGRATGPRLFRSECYHCDGVGHVVVDPCTTCSGDGRLTREERLSVRIPAGVATGQKLKLKGKGNAPQGSGPEGDLFVIVNVSDHALFRRRGEDVLVEVPLTLAEATLGADVTVPTLEGQTTIRVPAGTQHGHIFRLSGRGLPRVGRSSRGDLHLHVVLEIPSELPAEARKALASWAASLPTNAHPLRAQFDAASRDR